MARPLRIEYPGAFYHVINRGNAGDAIFVSPRDREKFIEYLALMVERFNISIHTYCLMSNHFHLLIETPLPNLSRAIQWLNVSYATYFNRKRKRHGHLLQGRYKAILVDADAYLKQLSRYIHLNPIRAKMVDKLPEFTWSSYPCMIGQRETPSWLNTGWLLSQFGSSRKAAWRHYRNFVEGADPACIEDPSKNTTEGVVLGRKEFVEWVKNTFLKELADNKEKPQLKKLKPKYTTDDIVSQVCMEFGCDREQVLIRGRRQNIARDVAIYLARDLSGQKGIELGSYFGLSSGSSITMRYNFVCREAAKENELKGKIDRIKERLMKI